MVVRDGLRVGGKTAAESVHILHPVVENGFRRRGIGHDRSEQKDYLLHPLSRTGGQAGIGAMIVKSGYGCFVFGSFSPSNESGTVVSPRERKPNSPLPCTRNQPCRSQI